jgi:hypothetical protein
MITARFHTKGAEFILAACDSELLGRRLEDADRVMDLGTDFFEGDEVTDDEFRGMLARATSANLVGPEAVRIAVEEGCVHRDAVGEVSGIPFAIFFCMG